jgi:hypothetical protein
MWLLGIGALGASILGLGAGRAAAPPDAYEHLVERVLASPHYGELRGRHWLGLARYGDSDGYEDDKRCCARSWRDRDGSRPPALPSPGSES